MRDEIDNETWLVEAGVEVAEKKVAVGRSGLTEMERLIDCLWVADYGMRNAGDLHASTDLYANFQEEAHGIAAKLSLTKTLAAFSLPKKELEARYFDLFDPVCDELRNVN